MAAPARQHDDQPDSVLFACNLNSVRSPMAEAIGKFLFGHKIFFDSVGVKTDTIDPFVIAVMDEIGIDMSGHEAKSFDDLEDTSFDLVISLTPEAQHQAVELTRTMACDVEYWPTFDPTIVTGSRETVLDSYREVRDALMDRIKARFDTGRAAEV